MEKKYFVLKSGDKYYAPNDFPNDFVDDIHKATIFDEEDCPADAEVSIATNTYPLRVFEVVHIKIEVI